MENIEKPSQLVTLVGLFKIALPAIFSPEKDLSHGALLVIANQH